ncbi:phage tail protein [Ruminococcus sp.]|uniref:phage tail-collar fiber domain-containing protein n=1 Tax=Ruminococcus sp. TaxID=41978 RepID=UPI00386327D2
MGKYNGAVITAAGQNLIAQAIAESKTVTFTTAQASSHVYPSSTDFEALTALTDVESTVNINYAGVYSDTIVQVSARFDNDGVETAYLINTLGFFAQLGTDTPILFAVSTAVTPDQMPVFDAGNPSAFIYNMQMTVQNANSINLSVNPAGTVTVEQLNATVSTINTSIGDLSTLTTDDKTSLVNAIDEVDYNANVAQVLVFNIGDTYSPLKDYKVGDLCIYNNVLYRCITACSAGSWEINQSCFTVDSLINYVSGLKPTSIAIIPNANYNFDGGGLYRIGTLVTGTISFYVPSINVGDGVQLGSVAVKPASSHIVTVACNSYGVYSACGTLAILTDGRIIFYSTISGACRVSGTFSYWTND